MEGAPARESFYTYADQHFFHNSTHCQIGAVIPKLERFAGDGRRRLCPVCRGLGEAALQGVVLEPRDDAHAIQSRP